MKCRFSVLGLLLGIAACSPQPAVKPAEAVTPAVASSDQAAAIPTAPPTVEGVYVAKGACPGEGCYLSGKIRAYEAADLYDKPGAGAAVVGKVVTGEWVEIVNREVHLIPMRGVVREGRKHFATGDVVYLLTSQGEGCFDTWSKGVVGSWCDPDASGSPAEDEAIDFDAAAEPPDSAGLWVEVTRQAGPGGWLHGVDDFACIGLQDRDADCPPLQQ